VPQSFYDAFSRFRNAQGKNTVSIALPVVLGVGFVADNDLADKLRVTLGGTLRIEDIQTIVKAAIQGQASPFLHNGKAVVFKLHVHGQPLNDIPWTYFHPVLLKDRLSANTRRSNQPQKDATADHATTSWTAAADPLVGMTEALVTKVSAMTMLPRDEVEPDAPLASLGLDSLVSVELRNWIRRETAVELALTTITQAGSLRALAVHILGLVDGQHVVAANEVSGTGVGNGEVEVEV
jgi:acyl carrier protein